MGVRAGLEGLTPGHLAFARYLVASLVFVVLMSARGAMLPPRRDIARLAVAGVAGISLYNLALNTGQQTVSPGVASLIVNTGPIWTAFLSLVFLGERIEARGWTGAAIAFAGVAVIASQPGSGTSAASVAPSEGFNPDVWLVFTAAVCQAVYFVVIKPLLDRHHPLQVTAWVVWIGTLFLAPFSRGLHSSLDGIDPSVLAAVAFLGVGPAALAYLAWSYVLSQLRPGYAANILYLIPVAAIAISWLVFRDMPSALQLGGGGLAVLGVAVSTGKTKCDV